MTDQSIDWILRTARRDRPLYLSLWSDQEDSSKPGRRRSGSDAYPVVTQFDCIWIPGRILAKLGASASPSDFSVILYDDEIRHGGVR